MPANSMHAAQFSLSMCYNNYLSNYNSSFFCHICCLFLHLECCSSVTHSNTTCMCVWF